MSGVVCSRRIGWRARCRVDVFLVEEDLRELGWEDIETGAYGDSCTTIRAMKPEGSGAWRGR